MKAQWRQWPGRLRSLFGRGPATGMIRRETGRRLLERLDGLRFSPATIVDLGAEDDEQARALARRFPEARMRVVAWTPETLARLRKRQRLRRRFELIPADPGKAPLPEASAELVHVHLALAHLDDLAAALAGLRRVLAPGGLLLVSMYGPDTLRELRDVEPDGALGLDHAVHAQQLGDALVRAGFREPVLDSDWLTSRHDTPGELARELAAARLLADGGNQAPTGGRTSVTWEIVYASAWAPEEGQPIRTGRGEEASVSVASLTRRQR